MPAAYKIITDYIHNRVCPRYTAAMNQPSARDTYHHGRLVEALVAATVTIIEEKGVDQVSVREAAKRVGVSPGAPFRHFRTKADLMTAVAEQAMQRLTEAVGMELAACPQAPPLQRLQAIGRAYLRWALHNPTHFQVISSRTLIRFSQSENLMRQNEALYQQMRALLEEAAQRGDLRKGLALDPLLLTARAFGYGLARMAVDGHYPEWHVEGPPLAAAEAALEQFISGLKA